MPSASSAGPARASTCAAISVVFSPWGAGVPVPGLGADGGAFVRVDALLIFRFAMSQSHKKRNGQSPVP